MILACQNIHKSFGTDTVLKDISFHLEERDKAALIGINGAGKSTLLRIITGEDAADSGTVTVTRGKTIGYLAQYQELEGEYSIYEEVRKARQDVLDMEVRLREMEKEMKHASGEAETRLLEDYTRLMHAFEQNNGYAVESEVTGVLKGLGFEEKDFSRTLSSLSGGQKTRIVLGRLLLTRPDILLLDEPTNHLDMASIEWLENYLRSYNGTVLIVSHDRYFLNRIVNRVIEIENGTSMMFTGNYNDYSAKKANVRKAQLNAWLKQQAEIRHQEEVIAKLKQFNREKSIKRAESREKLLEKVEILDKPTEVSAEMHIELKPRIESGKDVLTVEGLSMSYPGLPLFTDQSFEIKRGERVAIIGKNGTGKTTILKLINGLLTPDAGKIIPGAKVHIGYYDQEHQLLHPEKTIFEEISDRYPSLNQTRIRNVLAAFLFTGDDVFKKISSLSGGERGRVSLASLMLSEANFLILDEPTNHLDILSKEILEDALRSYSGTVLYVSHDRYFINQTATRILDLHDGMLINYIGNYDYYLEKMDELRNAYTAPKAGAGADSGAAADAGSVSAAEGSKAGWLAQKEEAARQRKKENAIRKVEEEIAALEARSKEIDEEFLLPGTGTDLPKCQALSREQEEINKKLEELYEKWEELSE